MFLAMANDTLNFEDMVEDAMRGVVRDALRKAARHGLPGDHHFYISFETNAPGTEISSRLGALHPEEMTIVIQNQFWNLAVDDSGFSIELSFSGRREYLYIPYPALTRFVDPSVNFGLHFSNGQPLEDDVSEEGNEAPPRGDRDQETGQDQNNDDGEEAAKGEKPAEEKIVSLDSFRKK